MDPALLAAIVKNILIPEIAAVVRAHRQATGNDPTDAEVLAALRLDTDRYIMLGRQFLSASN